MEFSQMFPSNVIFILSLITLTSAQLLTGDNICTHLENYTETVQEKYEEPVVVQTVTWCFAIPPRCPKSRTEMRIHYRMKEEVKHRNVSKCCKGYNIERLPIGEKFIDKCVPLTDCKPGYTGNNCDVECPNGSWGVKCLQKCDCGLKGICNTTNGQCSCFPGWQGSRCEDKCDEGKWGANCSLPCSCNLIDLTCHHETGECFKANGFLKIPPELINTPIKINNTRKLSTTDSTIVNSEIITSNNYEASDYFYETTANLTKINPIKTTTDLTTPLIDLSIDKYDNDRVANIFINSIGKSTSKPLLAVIHMSGRSSNHEMIVTQAINPDSVNSRDKIGSHAPVPLDIVLIVIASIISLGITSFAIFTILHIRSKLYETIRMSIYDAEKPDSRTNELLRRKELSEGNSTITRSSKILTISDYETPRFIIPERARTLPRPSASSTLTRESTYSNQYPNIHLFSSIRELLEAQYDIPPANNLLHQSPLDGGEVEHLYDEIPLQSINFGKSSDMVK